MRKLLCLLGFHKWGESKKRYVGRIGVFFIYKITADCQRCNKIMLTVGQEFVGLHTEKTELSEYDLLTIKPEEV